MLTTVPGHYLKMAKDCCTQEPSPLVLDQLVAVERTVQNAIRFEGRCTVDMALAIAMVSHGIATVKKGYDIASPYDELTLRLVEDMDK